MSGDVSFVQERPRQQGPAAQDRDRNPIDRTRRVTPSETMSKNKNKYNRVCVKCDCILLQHEIYTCDPCFEELERQERREVIAWGEKTKTTK